MFHILIWGLGALGAWSLGSKPTKFARDDGTELCISGDWYTERSTVLVEHEGRSKHITLYQSNHVLQLHDKYNPCDRGKDWSVRVLSIINRKKEKDCNQIMLTNFVTSLIFNWMCCAKFCFSFFKSGETTLHNTTRL